MRIVIDKREQSLYDHCQKILSEQLIPIFNIGLVQQELLIGDILLQSDDMQDIMLIERKSFQDLLASIKDGRYEEQSHRLLNTSELPPHSIIYLLEGIMSTVSDIRNRKIIYSAMTTLHFFKGFSVHRVSNTREAAEWILYMAVKMEKELDRGKHPYYFSSPFLNMYRKIQEKSPHYLPQYAQPFNTFSMNAVTTENTMSSDETPPPQPPQPHHPPNYCNFVKKVKKDNITPENIGEIFLCQIPGISSITAITIMKQYGTFPKLLEELKQNPQCLNGISCESSTGKTRKISKSSIENIRKFLLG